MKKSIAITIAGHRYNINLEKKFADFVEKDLNAMGFNFGTDNRAEVLLKSYLRLAKIVNGFEDELRKIDNKLDFEIKN